MKTDKTQMKNAGLSIIQAILFYPLFVIARSSIDFSIIVSIIISIVTLLIVYSIQLLINDAFDSVSYKIDSDKLSYDNICQKLSLRSMLATLLTVALLIVITFIHLSSTLKISLILLVFIICSYSLTVLRITLRLYWKYHD